MIKTPLPNWKRANAFALVIVLGVLVLLAGVVITFLSRASVERMAASGYRASMSARQLADTAVGLVQGQINFATSHGSQYAWVSQPGLVRTYDQNGNLFAAYKLYSAANMISTSVPISGTAGKSSDEPPAGWMSDSAIWVDLNAPMEIPKGTQVFPIVNPVSAAEGFSITAAPGATATQPAPMPVRWLYVLEDGTIAAPTGSGKSATVSEETSSNKIIGRIAFWTDDDTCKVNINTASIGTFWDVPRAYTTLGSTGIPTAGSLTQEQAFGYYQPIQKEFQRYPGHPAMTDFRAVFGTTLTTSQIFGIVPRIVGGGSTQGTVHVPINSTLSGYPKNDRLYADVDELIFDPNRGVNGGLTKSQLEKSKFFITAHSRAPETNLFNLPRIACWPIYKDLGAGMVTAFDQLIAFCSSTGSSSSPYRYYFQREKALDSTNDISIPRNKQLYTYLQYLTGQLNPGFGGDTFASKYGDDRDQILTEIFDYIRSTNLFDNTLASGNEFTSTSRGCIVPTVNGTNSSATMGFGRYFTLSELAIGFICNADGNDPTTTTASSGLGRFSSNIPTGAQSNVVLGGTALNPGEKYVQAIIIPEFFSVMYGFIALMPDMKLSISGLNQLSLNGQPLFPPDANATISYHDVYPDGSSLTATTNYSSDVASKYGGNPGWRYFGLGYRTPLKAGYRRYVPAARGNIPSDGSAGSVDEPYPFVSLPVKITDTGTMALGGALLTVTISDPNNNPVQVFSINLPSAGALPTPKLVTTGTIGRSNGGPVGIATTGAQDWWGFNVGCLLGPIGTNTAAGVFSNGGRLNNLQFAPNNRGTAATVVYYAGAFFRSGFDVIRSVLPRHGDFRLVAGRHKVPDTVFQKHEDYDNSAVMMASNLTNMADTHYDLGIFDTRGIYNASITFPGGHEPDISANLSVSERPESTGDYDDPLPDAYPGPYVNKPDEGSITVFDPRFPLNMPYYYSLLQNPYKSQGIDNTSDGGAFFSPNRMMPSPGMFGSLPTGVFAGKPWQTLLFRPQSAHPSAAKAPSDHLLLDLFWMPVVEPYAISDRFSTAGKINMNYQIFPFTYIKRSTGLRALLKSEMITAMRNDLSQSYKTTTGTKTVMRFNIDPDQTLSQFDTKFNTGDVFKSASEICDMHIVPTGRTASNMAAFWNSYALTGDNVRERIYTTLYPRLTTKSNTYTVHFKVQSLKKAQGSTVGIWTEDRDSVTGEYRGSATIERFIDANNSAIPDYAADPTQIPSLNTLDKFYKWRIISNRRFSP